ncbi:MAG: WD40 repeat domain-containing protein [Promethearchaeota archaeon]|nr:MAG: WD40 repeat domain-containing protein [Candidatus Lokiarchaeota archaeon]
METSKNLSKIISFQNIILKHWLELSNGPIEAIEIIDGANILIGFPDGKIKQFDINKNEFTKTYHVHTDSITCLIKEGSIIAAGSRDGKIKVWDTQSKEQFEIHKAHTHDVLDIKIKGDLLISCSNDCTIKFWDWKKGDCLDTIEYEHSRNITKIAINNNRVISASWDHFIKIWDISTRDLINSLEYHFDSIDCLVVNDSYIISGDKSGVIIIYELATGNIKTQLNHDRAITDLLIDNGNLYSSCKGGLVKVWDIESNICLRVLEVHNEAILKIKKRKNYLYFSSADGTLSVWDDYSITPIRELKFDGQILSLAHDDEVIVSAGDQRFLKVWDVKTGKMIKSIELRDPSWVWGLALSSKRIFSSSDNGNCYVYNLETGKLLNVLKGYNAQTYGFAIRNNILVTTSWAKKAKIWDLDNYSLIKELIGHTYAIYSAFITEDNRILTGSSDGKIRIWNLEGDCLRILTGHKGEIFDIASEKNIVVSACGDKSIRAYNIDSGECLAIFQGKMDQVWSITIKDGIIFAGTSDNNIVVWDLKKKTYLGTLKGHTEPVKSLIFIKNELLISGGLDGKILFWNVKDFLHRAEHDTKSDLITQLQIGRTYDILPPTLKNYWHKLRNISYAPWLINVSELVKKGKIKLNKDLNLEDLINDFPKNVKILSNYTSNIKHQETNNELLEDVYNKIDSWRIIGQIGYAPTLVEIPETYKNGIFSLGEDESLSTILHDYLLGILKSNELYWFGLLRYLYFNPHSKPSQWSFMLEFSGNGPNPVNGFDWKLLTPKQNDVLLNNRSETALVFKLTLDLPVWFIPLIDSIILEVKSDRGDKDEVIFNNFQLNHNKKWFNIALFKIDSSYRLEPIALIEISDIYVEYNRGLIPQGTEFNELKMEINTIKNQINLLMANIGTQTDNKFINGDLKNVERNIKSIKNSNMAKRVFENFQDSFKRPTIGTIEVKIGKKLSTIDKFLEYLQPKFIFLSIGSSIISFLLALLAYIAVFRGIDLLGPSFELAEYDITISLAEFIIYITVYGLILSFVLISVIPWLKRHFRRR